MNKLSRDYRTAIVAAALFVLAYAASVILFVMHLPEIGLNCGFRTTVNRVYPGFVNCPAGVEEQQLIEAKLVSVGGEAIHSWPQWVRLLRDIDELEYPPAADGFTGSAPTFADVDGTKWVRVELQRAQGPVSVWCRVGRILPSVVLPSILWFVLETGLFLVALIVYWKRPHDRAARLFYVQALVVIGAYMGGYHWGRITTQPALTAIYILCAVLLPAVNLHFFLLFPSPRPALLRRPRQTLLAVYGVPVVFLALILSGYGAVRWLGRNGATPERVNEALAWLGQVVFVYIGVAAAWYVASIVALVVGYYSTREGMERNQIRWILMSSVLALGPIAYSWYLAYWHPTEFGGGAAVWPMFAASITFTLSYAVGVTRYRLLQFDQYLNSGLAYFVVSCLAAVVYCALVVIGMLVFGTRGPTIEQAAWVSGSSLVLSIGLDSARSRLRNYLNKRYRRDKTQLDLILERLGEAVGQLVDMPTLANRLLQVSAELHGFTRGTVYIWNAGASQFQLAGSLGMDASATGLAMDGPLATQLRDRAVLERTTLPPLHPARLEMFSNGGDVAVALSHEGRLIGMLLLARPAGQVPGQHDAKLLAAFAPIAALALAGAEVRHTVEDLNGELQDKVEKISEQQRRILSLQQQLIAQSRRAPAPTPPADEAGKPEEKPAPHLRSLVGSSPALQHVLDLIPKVATNYSTVLVRGESGTGKELLAKALHDLSPRAAGPFVKVHCAALAPGVLESELFGHVKGSFTGATRDKPGRFEGANGGTLFLDEIGDINGEVQTKLLRVLQEKTFERVGSNEPIRVDVRLVTATHQDLERLIRDGRFRADLYYRLNVITLNMPPLRERGEDVIELAHHFLRNHAERCHKTIEAIDDDALLALRFYHWPGNIRELENAIERAVVVAESSTITIDDLPAEFRQAPSESPGRKVAAPAARPGSTVMSARMARHARERDELVRALEQSRWNRTEAARQLGMARSTLLSRMKKFGLQDAAAK